MTSFLLKLKLNLNLTAQIPQQIAVAWSGGADSTALLLLLHEAGYDVQAWHVDHGWHEGSSTNARDLAIQAKVWGIPFHFKQIQKPTKNIESEARKGRYLAFEQLAEETACSHLALGHHAADQAETVCMRLLQGAGVAGCQGMRAHRQQKKLHLWRPLLHVSRQDIELFLKNRSVLWLDDPSNEDTSLWRNKIRQKLFPLIEAKGFSPQSLYLRWQTQAEKVQQQIITLAQHVKIIKQLEADSVLCEVDWLLWCGLPKPVRAYVLQKMVGLLFDEGVVLGRRHILAIEQWREHGGHSWLNLSGCCLYREGQGLQLCRGKMSLRKSSAKSVSKG